jgi:DNA-binding response OmpR family regulator
MLNPMNLPTILHVEDDENDRLLLSIAQTRAKVPAHLIPAEDGEQAIAYLEDNPERPGTIPDLVLLDLKLPLKSGFEVLEWIRAQDRLQNLPVIILSSSEHERDRERAFGSGANFYMVKPVSIGGMVEVMKQVQANWLSPFPLCGCA